MANIFVGEEMITVEHVGPCDYRVKKIITKQPNGGVKTVIVLWAKKCRRTGQVSFVEGEENSSRFTRLEAEKFQY